MCITVDFVTTKNTASIPNPRPKPKQKVCLRAALRQNTVSRLTMGPNKRTAAYLRSQLNVTVPLGSLAYSTPSLLTSERRCVEFMLQPVSVCLSVCVFIC